MVLRYVIVVFPTGFECLALLVVVLEVAGCSYRPPGVECHLFRLSFSLTLLPTAPHIDDVMSEGERRPVWFASAPY
ncbi:hypothetical protein L484_014831 [Morus notabilis]|uniref:Uncharacterized protein n=1 Tax=Morus notabilis TaxID=981085 RepID=W9QEZ0_9ROSA|nr:hypothetical protein L484_014831 [Morus notabilis]